MSKEPKTLTTRHTYWHFLRVGRRMRFGGQLVRKGVEYHIDGEPALCEWGLHASYRAIDALKYAPGPVVCRVRLGGKFLADKDKVVAQKRTVLEMADATNVLHEFACRCAEIAFKSAKVTDTVIWKVVETKRLWLLGLASGKDVDAAESAARAAARSAARSAARAAARAAARSAARAAARAAAWSAARSAAESAAWSAARSAAESAAESAAWSAAESAAWSAQNDILENLLRDLLSRSPSGRRSKSYLRSLTGIH